MGGAHGHLLHFHGHSPVHRAPAHLKIVALLVFMIGVVATPDDWYAAFAVYLVALLAVIRISRVPTTYILKRMVVEVPFVFFALLLPIIARGPRVDVLGLSLSESGLRAGFGLLATATLGVIASLTLAATTEPQAILKGLERLHLPSQLVQIMSFMVRYLEVVTDELRRMRIARESRGFEGRNPKHWPVLARSFGALFIRSFERGERVHLAMLSRGYCGKMPL